LIQAIEFWSTICEVELEIQEDEEEEEEDGGGNVNHHFIQQGCAQLIPLLLATLQRQVATHSTVYCTAYWPQ
jgi:importin subunit beta-1